MRFLRMLEYRVRSCIGATGVLVVSRQPGTTVMARCRDGVGCTVFECCSMTPDGVALLLRGSPFRSVCGSSWQPGSPSKTDGLPKTHMAIPPQRNSRRIITESWEVRSVVSAVRQADASAVPV
jgi:hypothetical protein